MVFQWRREGVCSSFLAEIYLHIRRRDNNLNSNIFCYRYIDDILIVRINRDNTHPDFTHPIS